MDFLIDLLGRFHPLIVHLPIGFLLLGLMMLVFDRKESKHLNIIRFTFFWGTLSTLIAIFTGTIQLIREGYPWEDVQGHLIFGVFTFILSFLIYLKLKGYRLFQGLSHQFLGYGLLVILLITGHLGGNLTHGRDHLTAPLPSGLKEALGIKVPSQNLVLLPDTYQELPLYLGVIQPILDQKCVSCHNPKKTKGALLLHNYKGIINGGEEGPIISRVSPQKSEMLKRIHLPKDEKKHMPPKAKSQLSKAEIKLIGQWINLGAPENATISDLNLSQDLFASFFPNDETGIYPETGLKPLNKVLLDSLIKMGLQVTPIYKTSSQLRISTINVPDFNDQSAALLLMALDHIVDLDLGQTRVTDTIFDVLQQLKYLTVLKLNRTTISGNGINKLESLQHLKQINLVNSNFDGTYLEDLYSFPALEKVYLFGTSSNTTSIEIPKPYQTIFERGNYKLDKEVEETL